MIQVWLITVNKFQGCLSLHAQQYLHSNRIAFMCISEISANKMILSTVGT